MMRHTTLILTLYTVLLLISTGCSDNDITNPGECPFEPMVYSQSKYVEREVEKRIAVEITADLSALGSTIKVDGVGTKAVGSVKETWKENEEKLLNTDSVFVNFMNAEIKVTCMYWTMYEVSPNDESVQQLKNQIAKISQFITEYYREGNKIKYKQLDGLDNLIANIVSFSDELAESKMLTTIQRNNFEAKAEFYRVQLNTIDPINASEAEITMFVEIRSVFEELRTTLATINSPK